MNIVVLDFVEAATAQRRRHLVDHRSRGIAELHCPRLVAEFGLALSAFVFLVPQRPSVSLVSAFSRRLADWGSMVRDNATLITYGDVTPLLPAAAIAVLTVGVNFVVDWFLYLTSGLRDDH